MAALPRPQRRGSVNIAYLGGVGSYSELALHAYLATASEDDGSQLCAYPTIPQVLQALRQQQVSRAIVPVENSVQGGVTLALDSLWELAPLYVWRALVVPIRHALITQATHLSQIQMVLSHPQGLAQCQVWLATHLPQADLIPVNATTEGLPQVARDPAIAAIASIQAAEAHGLPVRAAPINDYADNCTRFWVLGTTPPPPTPAPTHTSLAFSLRRNIPGALVQSLSFFAERSINLSRIESRPTKRSLGEYIFFLDLEAASTEPRVAAAIEQLNSHTETLHLFGSYAVTTVTTS
ncbi:MAG: prephenate dehydratase [Oscillatoriales cyanobacterium SM2_2_1]|nr:prephenate dehydratase [Oscillatoriales cyanobacterium SM2_2_1]